MTDPRRAGVVALLVVLAGAALLLSLPRDLADVRFRGLALSWWYGAVAGPVAAVVIAVLSLLRRRTSRGVGTRPPA